MERKSSRNIARGRPIFVESKLDAKKRTFYLWGNALGFPGVILGLFIMPLGQNPSLILIIAYLISSIVLLVRHIAITTYERIASIGISAFTICYTASTWLFTDLSKVQEILGDSYKLYFLNLLILNIFITHRPGWYTSFIFTALFTLVAASRGVFYALEGNFSFIYEFFTFIMIAIVMIIFLNVFAAYREELVRERLLSSTDPLTGAHNRRFALERLETWQQNQVSFSLILLDLDHFKKINDQYGHTVGDVVLCQVVQLAQQVIGLEGVVRWGGEEFLLLLPNTTLEQAASLADDLRVTLEQARWGEVSQVTASLGVVQTTALEGYSQALMRADIALWAAKNSGRNQVKLGK
jgi:diguanylate cyclase (GGDEF)-like protein